MRFRTAECGDILIPGGGAIFGQCLGSVPIHHHEESGSLLIYTYNSTLENQTWAGKLDVLATSTS